MTKFVRKLEPRMFESNEIIQEQFEEVFEVVFVISGIVGVGYRLFSETFYGKSIIMSKTKKIISPINDYSCLKNKSSEFHYKTIEKTKALSIRRQFFN